MEREGYHPRKAFVPCVRERVGWNVTSDRSSANFAPICQNKTQFGSATKCQSQTESTGYYLLSPSTFSPALPLIQTSRRMSMIFVRNRFSGTGLLEGTGHTTLTVWDRLWSLAVGRDGSDCVCTCLIISLCLKCWFTHTDPLYRISKQWRIGGIITPSSRTHFGKKTTRWVMMFLHVKQSL